MSDNKKYYYLKLKENFFDREEVRAIKGMEKGDTYVCIMLEMYLRSLKREGKLMVTDRIPFNLKSLSSVLGRSIDEVKFAVDVFLDFGLIELLDTGAMFMSDIQNFIGTGSSEAERKAQYRSRIKQEKKDMGQCPDDRPPEIELEKETDIDIEIEKKTNAQIAQGDLFYSETTPVSTDINNDDIFEVWWSEYDKKVDKKKCYNKWSKHIPKKLYNSIIEHTRSYVKATPDVRYRKAPLTYLNGANWEDEIQPHKSQKAGTQFSTKNGQVSEDYGF